MGAFLMNLLWIIIGLVVFAFVMSVLVIVHEGGHFIAAKKAGILCHEFSIGMGPVIFKKKKGETVYSLRAFPIGGFVAMAGEEVEENILKDVNKVKLVIDKETNRVTKIIVNLDNPKYSDLPTYVLGNYDLIGTKKALDDELFIEVRDEDENDSFERYIVNRDCLVNFEKKTEIQIAPYDRNFVNKPLLNRFISVFAGPFMNIVLAVVIFFFIGLFSGYPNEKDTVIDKVTVVEGSNNLLVSGDRITSINGQETKEWGDISRILGDISKGGNNYTSQIRITTDNGKDFMLVPSVFIYTVELAFKADGTNEAIIGKYSSNNEKTKAYLAGLREEDKIIGVYAIDPKTKEVIGTVYDEGKVLSKSEILAFFNTDTLAQGPDVKFKFKRTNAEGAEVVLESELIEAYDSKTLNSQNIEASKVQLGITCQNKFNLGKLFYMPIVETANNCVSIFKTLGLLFSKSRIGVDDLSGPVGIFTILKESVKQGTVFIWMAILSVNLGIMNLLPLPALDGGRITFMVYELITRKKPNAKVENTIHTIGLMLLMALMIFISFNDVLRCLGC